MARLSDQEIQRRYDEQLKIYLGSITDEQAEERWPDCKPVERNRRKILKEKQLARYNTVVDDETDVRMMGGPQVSRSAGKEIGKAVAEAADGHRQKEVMDALFAPLSDKSNAVRGKGAERIIKISAEQAEKERRDREELRQLGRDELVAELAKLILVTGTAATLAEQINKGSRPKVTIEAEAHEVQANGTGLELEAGEDAERAA